jgi:hypothetical protein
VILDKPLALTVDQVSRLAAEAARDTSPDLRVAGVTMGRAADGAYVEILVNITGCRGEVCQVSVGVFRNVEATELRKEVARKLRDHLDHHASTP